MPHEREVVEIPRLNSRPLFEMEAELEPESQVVGATPAGQRIIAISCGGTIKGEHIKGIVLPGGGDWICVRQDGSFQIDVRACLKTDDGVLIYMTYGGRLIMPPRHFAALADRGVAATIDPSEYYFRINPVFEAPSPSNYAWLNHVVAIGVGRITQSGVGYSVHEIM